MLCVCVCHSVRAPLSSLSADEIFDLLCAIPRGRADRPIPQIKEGRHDKIEVENIVKQEVKGAEETLESDTHTHRHTPKHNTSHSHSPPSQQAE